MSILVSSPQSRIQQFYALTKPRVVSLIVFTAVIGMFLATPGMVPPNNPGGWRAASMCRHAGV